MTSSSKTTLALAALFAATSAHSSSSTSGVIEGVQNFSGIDFDRVDCAGCVDQGANTDSSPYGTSTITAYAMSDYGVLKTAASATGVGDGASGRVDASTTFADQFEIDAAGLTGQQGHFKARVAMPFTASVSAELYTLGSLSAFVRVNDKETRGEQYGSANGATTSYVDHDGVELAIGTPTIFDVSFVYGQPITVFGFMDIAIQGQTSLAYPTFAATVDASHSLYWQGISEVTDGRGNLVADYTLMSAAAPIGRATSRRRPRPSRRTSRCCSPAAVGWPCAARLADRSGACPQSVQSTRFDAPAPASLGRCRRGASTAWRLFPAARRHGSCATPSIAPMRLPLDET